MVDASLVHYISVNLCKGYSPDKLKHALVSGGWSVDDVTQAFALCQPARQQTQYIQPPHHEHHAKQKTITAQQLEKTRLQLKLAAGVAGFIVMSSGFSLFLDAFK